MYLADRCNALNDYDMKNTLKTFVLILSIFFSLNLYSQFLEPKISVGLLSSDIREPYTFREAEKRRNANNNAPKIGFYTTLSSGIKLYRWLHLEFGATYQERLPLEKFTFSDRRSPTGFIGGFSFSGYPTSPQSRLWNEAIYLRFPNFKYVHFELIPTFSFGKKKLKVELGAGVFYGYLLNHRTLQFSEEDFPVHAFFFQPPINVFGIDSYNQHDVGWIPKFSIAYRLNNRYTLGISAKSYISQYSLKSREIHDGLVSKWNRYENTTWLVYAAGIDFTYDLYPVRNIK